MGLAPLLARNSLITNTLWRNNEVELHAIQNSLYYVNTEAQRHRGTEFFSFFYENIEAQSFFIPLCLSASVPLCLHNPTQKPLFWFSLVLVELSGFVRFLRFCLCVYITEDKKLFHFRKNLYLCKIMMTMNVLYICKLWQQNEKMFLYI
jgi:hypothetical protein